MQSCKREFFVTWRIKNFSMRPSTDCSSETSYFLVKKWYQRKLMLVLIDGIGDSTSMSCYAVVRGENMTDNTDLEYTIAVGKAEESTTETKRLQWDLKRSVRFGVANLIGTELFEREDTFLPNDTLTIYFRMWITDEVTETTAFTPLDLYQQNVYLLSEEVKNEFKTLTRTQVLVNTRVVVNRKLLMWPIKTVEALESNGGMCLSVPAILSTDTSFEMHLFLSDEPADREDRLEIRIEQDDFEDVFLKCKITILNSMMTPILITDGDHVFEEDGEEWTLFLSDPKSELQKFINSKSEVFLLRCDLKFSDKHTETVDEVPVSFTSCLTIASPTTLGNEFRDLYRTGMLSDVTLRAEERQFKAHKVVLGTRSSVFRKMFETQMKEKETGFVDITDLDPDTLDKLLVYLYSEHLDDLDPEVAARLYSAADKYDVPSLKDICSVFLQSALSVSNASSILNLADLHADETLLKVVKWFIFGNSEQVFATSDWKTLMETNVKLSASIMYQILTSTLIDFYLKGFSL